MWERAVGIHFDAPKCEDLAMPNDVPYERRALLRRAVVIVAFGIPAVLFATGYGDLFGREPGPVFRFIVGWGVLGMCAWLSVGVVQRARSDDPAISFRSDALRLHVQPGRPLELRLDEISGIGPVHHLRSRFDGRRLVLGERVFHISTTRTGMRARHVLVGSSPVGIDLSVARDDCHRWWSDGRG